MSCELEEMLALADELADKLDQMPFGSPNTLLRRVERALRTAATPAPGYAQNQTVSDLIDEMANDWLTPNWHKQFRKDCEKLVQVAIASLPATAGVEDWQPIETAPKDGSEVLLWIGEPWRKVEKARWYEPWGNWQAGAIPNDPDLEDYCGIGSSLPTHWRPLYTAPPSSRMREALDEDPLADRLLGRASFLRDRGEIKSPELMEKAAQALRAGDNHASDGKESEGGGQVAPAKCSATGVHPTDTSCAAEPEVAPGPSDANISQNGDEQ